MSPEALPELEEAQQELLRSYQQCDVLEELTDVPVIGTSGPIRYLAPYGVVVLSQTCDIVLADRLTVQVAPLRVLTGSAAKEALAGKRPRFVHVPEAGINYFADLEVVATVAKSQIARLSRRGGVASDEARRTFRQAVARRFARFPFPDEVTPWLRPLEKVVASKSVKPATPEGKVLEQVTEFRVEADGGWLKAPFNLTLVILVKPGTLATFPGDSIPDCPTHLQNWIGRPGEAELPTSAEVARALSEARDPVEIYWLWWALGEAWAAACQPPKDAAREVLGAIQGSALGVDLISTDEYTYDRYRRSEALDLDHLSAPLPE